MYQISHITNLDNSEFVLQYRNLVSACPDATLFNDWPWLSSTVQHLEGNESFLALEVKNAQQTLVAFVALKVKKENIHKVPARVARFVQYPLGDRIAVLIHPEHLDCWALVLDEMRSLSQTKWDCLIFNEWTDNQGLIEQAKAYASRRHQLVHHRVTSHCPYLELDFETEDKMVASYTSKMRSDLKRRKKKLAKLNSEIVHVRPSGDEALRLLETFRKTEAASWKGNEGVGIFNDPTTQGFFKTVTERLADVDQLDLSLVYIDDELASYKYGFYFRNDFLDYSIGYLPQYAKLGLGRILLDELVLAALREGYNAVDASRVGVVSRHLLFERTDKVIKHSRFYFFRKSLKGFLLWFLVVYAKPQMKQLRQAYREWKTAKNQNKPKAER